MIKQREIRLLHAILSTGSISGAASLLNVSQPAASKALSGLEGTLGFKLFNRTRGQLEAIPGTTYLFEELENCLNSIARLDESVRNAQSSERDLLSIASLPGPANFLIPNLLKEYFGNDRSRKFSLITRTTPVIRDLVTTQQIEIGVLVSPPPSSSYTSFSTPNQYVCAMRPDHPLAQKSSLKPKDLEGHALTVTSPGHAIFQQLTAAFHSEGVNFEPSHEVPYYMPALGFSLAGLGVSFIDTITAWSFENLLKSDGLVFKKFEPTIYDNMSVITPALRTLPNGTCQFRDFLVEKMLAMRRKY